ncbi:N-acetyltransferase [Salinispora arenicola]|uniref:N-acetyltransferase n=1 Tax=Salinispora arenicola TaxID=168697 RepID=UPI0016BD3DB4|nr:N-acetyltransferase [Salinispora arenicola]NIL55708.1 N-acetyltransferase [Salinispora arenicola]NIL61173.1 N-acetyltransferase [Salinispora arenicola]
MCSILEITGKVGRVGAPVVDNRYRGQGIDIRLLAELETRARAAGCPLLEVRDQR